ncbi:MAG TPA: GTP cyclohydrolase I, partial [Chitinophagales bacterium]|nr:GTP cyclohydrolase I [Chitinophagales bacterium]
MENNELILESNPVIEKYYREILSHIGEDPNREGLLQTPNRVSKSLQYMTHGYSIDPIEIVRSAVFNEDHNQMVIVKDIE